jgi:hypothetical protein
MRRYGFLLGNKKMQGLSEEDAEAEEYGNRWELYLWALRHRWNAFYTPLKLKSVSFWLGRGFREPPSVASGSIGASYSDAPSVATIKKLWREVGIRGQGEWERINNTTQPPPHIQSVLAEDKKARMAAAQSALHA